MVTVEKTNYLPFTVGVLLTFLGGAIAIGIAVWVTQKPDALWAILLLMWGLERVQEARVAKKNAFIWRPALVGLIIGACYLGLGAVAYYLKDAGVLWAMILVNFLADKLVDLPQK